MAGSVDSLFRALKVGLEGRGHRARALGCTGMMGLEEAIRQKKGMLGGGSSELALEVMMRT